MLTRKLYDTSGVTLIEVMVALAVASISILSLMIMFPKVKATVDVAHHKAAAIQACQAKVEDFRRAGFLGLQSSTFPTQELVILDSGDASIATDDIKAVLTTSANDIFSGGVLIAKKVLVQCQWNENHAVVNEYLDFILYRNVP